jgi:hypothetical protein
MFASDRFPLGSSRAVLPCLSARLSLDLIIVVADVQPV